ncbi:hypothetical protein MXD62_21950 [Frankia sp. Mgl5]|uniref:hypothetical protein n=1 Tax=Frankia sp. Mgl5 TaxID=2933793 RepID=UPI00200D9DD9|nr:hypothetical protein [Frankia sp. Mgl5]MCK9929801.1 hypothetical protein [Frankia sp. Mgl5]
MTESEHGHRIASDQSELSGLCSRLDSLGKQLCLSHDSNPTCRSIHAAKYGTGKFRRLDGHGKLRTGGTPAPGRTVRTPTSPTRVAVVELYTHPPARATVIRADGLGPVIRSTPPSAPGWPPDGHRPKAACWLNLQEDWWRLLRRAGFAGQTFVDTDEIIHAVDVATIQLNAARNAGSEDASPRRPGKSVATFVAVFTEHCAGYRHTG